MVTKIPDAVHGPAYCNIRIGDGTFDRCGPGAVVQNGQLSKRLPSVHLPQDLVVFKDFQLSVCRKIHSMSKIKTNPVIKKSNPWYLSILLHVMCFVPTNDFVVV